MVVLWGVSKPICRDHVTIMVLSVPTFTVQSNEYHQREQAALASIFRPIAHFSRPGIEANAARAHTVLLHATSSLIHLIGQYDTCM